MPRNSALHSLKFHPIEDDRLMDPWLSFLEVNQLLGLANVESHIMFWHQTDLPSILLLIVTHYSCTMVVSLVNLKIVWELRLAIQPWV